MPLRWSSGTRAVAEGNDLATVAKGLTMAELMFWVENLKKTTCFHEAGVLQAEIDRRDPKGVQCVVPIRIAKGSGDLPMFD